MMWKPLHTKEDVEAVAAAILNHLNKACGLCWTNSAFCTPAKCRCENLSKDLARSALSIAAPRIAGNVVREMATEKPNFDCQAAGLEAFCAEVKRTPLPADASKELRYMHHGSLIRCGTEMVAVFRAMITAYARERGVEISITSMT